MYDNTYKTNNKGLAFFQVVSLNQLGKVFSCAFGLIDNERQEGFDWLMDQVNAHRERIGAGKPAITLTDFDKAMKNAVARVYPDADAQICIFHINKNVVLQVKRKWDKRAAAEVNAAYLAQQGQAGVEARNRGHVGDESTDFDDGLDEEDRGVVNRLNRIADGAEPLGPLPDVIEYSRAGLYKLWEHILYAPTIEGFNLAYEKLKAFFPQQVEILNYIEETYMPIVKEWATCYTNKRLNFGHRTTSPVEVVNRYLKSFIITGNSTVLDAVIQSFNMIDQMKEGIQEARLHQIYHIKREYIGQKWLGDAALEISDEGMKKVVKQYRIMLGAVPTPRNPTPAPLNACTGQFTAQHGIPCSHQLFDRYMDGHVRLERGEEGKLVLNKLDFHPY